MAKINVTAYPYATICGEIEVPSNIKGEENIKAYIEEHWNDVKFGESSLDFVGTEFDIEEE